jgi:hypothetical protein
LQLLRLDHAAQAFDAARALALGATETQLAYQAKAGLARVALARGDTRVASAFAEELLSYLAWGGQLIGPSAHSIRLTCFEVLARLGDPRAAEVLSTAQRALAAIAETIPNDDLRRCYLENIPDHRTIATAPATPAGRMYR